MTARTLHIVRYCVKVDGTLLYRGSYIGATKFLEQARATYPDAEVTIEEKDAHGES